MEKDCFTSDKQSPTEVQEKHRENEEEACWAILEREHAMNTPVVIAVISIRAWNVEVC